MLDRYIQQVRLLLDVLPDVAAESAFALKGGTAINLFHRDMPRLSVDIDLTWLPISDRFSSLKEIDSALDRVATSIVSRDPGVAVKRAGGGSSETRMVVTRGRVQIKIETSPVTRGAVLPPRTMVACEAVTDQFGFVETKVLSFEDLYVGKLVAALDRQHPRDLFDVKLLYENEGLTEDLFRVFLVYVTASRRPMHELLAPASPPGSDWYNAEFTGMAREPVSPEALIRTRRRLHEDVQTRLTGGVATFLLSLHDARPDFGLIGLSQVAELPAVRWKIINLELQRPRVACDRTTSLAAHLIRIRPFRPRSDRRIPKFCLPDHRRLRSLATKVTSFRDRVPTKTAPRRASVRLPRRHGLVKGKESSHVHYLNSNGTRRIHF